jgi:hypothetical protein
MYCAGSLLKFRRNILPASSGSKNAPGLSSKMKEAARRSFVKDENGDMLADSHNNTNESEGNRL